MQAMDRACMGRCAGRFVMEIRGSCHCGGVQFSVQSPHPYPFNLCYCSICRKTAGGGGYAIHLSGRFKTLKVRGKGNLAVYRAKNARRGDRKNHPQLRPTACLQKIRQRAVAVGPAVTGTGAPVRLGDRYGSPGTVRANTFDARLKGQLGAGPGRSARPAVRRVPGKIDCAVAPASAS